MEQHTAGYSLQPSGSAQSEERVQPAVVELYPGVRRPRGRGGCRARGVAGRSAFGAERDGGDDRAGKAVLPTGSGGDRHKPTGGQGAIPSARRRVAGDRSVRRADGADPAEPVGVAEPWVDGSSLERSVHAGGNAGRSARSGGAGGDGPVPREHSRRDAGRISIAVAADSGFGGAAGRGRRRPARGERWPDGVRRVEAGA